MCASIVHMTQVIPEVLLGDRMRISLRHAGLGVGEMAEYLDVGRNTVSTWINGRIQPSKQTLRLWSMRTGVPLEWLERGEMQEAGQPRGTDPLPVRHHGLEPRTRCLPAGLWFESLFDQAA